MFGKTEFVMMWVTNTFVLLWIMCIYMCRGSGVWYSHRNLSSGENLWQGQWQKQNIDCQRTHWLHIPKTSSMFCLSIQHTCCPAKYEKLTAGVTTEILEKALLPIPPPDAEDMGFNSSFCYEFYRAGHPPLDCKFAGPVDHSELEHVSLKQEMAMAIIREPKSRVISAYLDNLHREGFPFHHEYLALKAKLDTIDRTENLSVVEGNIKKAQLYANHPYLKGLQVKLLISNPHQDFTKTNDIPMLETLVDQAIAKLRQFFFVGVFDEYVRSIKLFHELANVGKYGNTVTPVLEPIAPIFLLQWKCYFDNML